MPGGDVLEGAVGGEPALGRGQHHRGRAVAVQQGGDDAAVEEAESVVVLGPRPELGPDGSVGRLEALQLQALRVARPAAEAGGVGEEAVLDARPGPVRRRHPTIRSQAVAATWSTGGRESHRHRLARSRPRLPRRAPRRHRGRSGRPGPDPEHLRHRRGERDPARARPPADRSRTRGRQLADPAAPRPWPPRTSPGWRSSGARAGGPSARLVRSGRRRAAGR